MTNAEAIETLRANYPDACYEQLREAVDAAIDALKAQDAGRKTMHDELVERLRAESYTLEELSIILPRAADAIEELMRRCEQFQYMPPPAWIPVTERLPENEVTVLVVRKFLGIKDCPAKTYVETAEYCYGDWVADSDEYKIARSKHTDPLYWMPLPNPPKGERKDDE